MPTQQQVHLLSIVQDWIFTHSSYKSPTGTAPCLFAELKVHLSSCLLFATLDITVLAPKAAIDGMSSSVHTQARRHRKIQLMRRSTSSVDLAASLPAPGFNERGIHDPAVTASATEASVSSTAETQQPWKLITRPIGLSLPRAISLPSYNQPSPSALILAPPEQPVPPTWLSLGFNSAKDEAGDSTSNPPTVCLPRFGFTLLPGRSRQMEDALTIVPCLIPPRTADSRLLGRADEAGSSTQHTPPPPLSFFAVFDGHGGTYVSALCKEQMHLLLAEELTLALGYTDVHHQPAALLPATQPTPHPWSHHVIPTAIWRQALSRCFDRVDQLALSYCACGRVAGGSCACEQSGLRSNVVGSTAVVAVIDRDQVVVANCGDSRAVLGRAGKAVPLSVDQKPDRHDEQARIEEAGGMVIDLYGVARVMGMLAMSRAIGDKYLKPAVISEPEITVTDRTSEDEFLIVASDGLWDVISNDLACNIVRRCLNDSHEPQRNEEGTDTQDGVRGPSVLTSDGHCTLAATVLTRMALGRMSRDDISVIVVDLRTWY